MSRAFLQSKILLLQMCPSPPSASGRHSHFVHWWRRTWGLCYCFPHLLIEGTAILTFISPVTGPMPGSKQTFHKCWMNEGWMEDKSSESVTLVNRRILPVQCSSSHHLETEAMLYQKPTDKMYIRCQSNNLICWHKNQINTLYLQIAYV